MQTTALEGSVTVTALSWLGDEFDDIDSGLSWVK
jgi:hypothetical protein